MNSLIPVANASACKPGRPGGQRNSNKWDHQALLIDQLTPAVLRSTTVLFSTFLLVSNHFERLDCSQNLMRWHKGLLYSKWSENIFSYT